MPTGHDLVGFPSPTHWCPPVVTASLLPFPPAPLAPSPAAWSLFYLSLEQTHKAALCAEGNGPGACKKVCARLAEQQREAAEIPRCTCSEGSQMLSQGPRAGGEEAAVRPGPAVPTLDQPSPPPRPQPPLQKGGLPAASPRPRERPPLLPTPAGAVGRWWCRGGAGGAVAAMVVVPWRRWWCCGEQSCLPVRAHHSLSLALTSDHSF